MGKSAKFIFGAIVGAAATALLTPVTGRGARRRASKWAKTAGVDSKSVKDTTGEVKKRGSEILERARISASQQVGRQKQKSKNKSK